MPKFSEKSLVEDYIIEKLIEKDWRLYPLTSLSGKASVNLCFSIILSGLEVRSFVRRYVKRYGLKLDELNSLYHNLMENVENYGKPSSNSKQVDCYWSCQKIKDYGDLIEKHKDWIFKRSSEIAIALEQAQKKNLDLERTDEELKQMIASIIENISSDLKVNIYNIYFRRMKSKWGSCSPDKNLTINTLLKYLPDNLIEFFSIGF